MTPARERRRISPMTRDQKIALGVFAAAAIGGVVLASSKPKDVEQITKIALAGLQVGTKVAQANPERLLKAGIAGLLSEFGAQMTEGPKP
jgi:hypothetical protein